MKELADEKIDLTRRLEDTCSSGSAGCRFRHFDPGVVIRNGKGSRVWDEDGNEFIDYLIGSGPMILGPRASGSA